MSPFGTLASTGPNGPEPPGDDGDDDDDDDEDGDDDEELVQDSLPMTEKDIVDSRSLQHAKIDPIPTTAADFRVWKNSVLLLLGRIDVSGIDYLPSWFSVAFKVDSVDECMQSAGLVPRLDRWLAAELIKGLKQVPELQFKVQGYVENCTRKGSAPRGRAIAHMISRHFDLDCFRGSLITSQSVFAIELHGYSISDLQDFSSQVMKVLNQIPQDEWPSQRMLGEFLFSKLRTVRRLERVIDEVKRSPEFSEKRNFDFLWTQLQEFLVEEREELNARSVEQSLRSSKKATQPKAKPLAAPAVQPKSISSKQPEVKAAPVNPKAVPKAGAKEGGKGKGKSKTKSPEEKAKTACIFHQMPSGCVHGDKCAYSHAASAKSSAPKPSAEAKSKPKASGPSPKVAAAVALVTALSSVARPSQAFGTLEWAADSGAGRHLISHEALRDQGFGEPRYGNFLNQSHENLRFSTGGGQRKSSQALGVRDHAGVFGDANHFVLDSCPCVRSVGLDVKDGFGFAWFPGQLPFYIKDCSKISLCCAEDNKIFANRVSENVPFFSMNFDFIPGMPAKAVADPGDIEVLTPPELAMEPVVSAVEPGLEGGAESSSVADIEVFTPPELAMEPVVSAVEPGLEGGAESSSIAAKVREVAPDVPLPKLPESTVHARAEAVSIKHRISHFPKHPLCDICNRAKLFSKRVKSHRVHDPESDLPVPTAFGEQIAIDHMIVSKSAGGREFLALIVFDCFSGIVNAYPAPTKGSDFVYSCLRHFVGMRYKNPDTVCRSDAAPELIKAIRELGWLPETSLPRRWPHNSRCERAIRSFEECCRCLHLQAGFAVMPRLWVTTCRYAAMAMNIDKWESAFGTSFKGADYALGQLVFYRTKSQYKPKLDPNAQPALMAGWKLEFGMRYRGVLLVLDYHALREGKITCVQAPDREVYTRDTVTFPLANVAERALDNFSDPSIGDLESQEPLPIPFVEDVPEIKEKSKRVYITYGRIQKLGATDGCRACLADAPNHTPECIARHEEAFGSRTPGRASRAQDDLELEELLAEEFRNVRNCKCCV